MSVAVDEREPLACAAQNVLLDDFQRVFRDRRDYGDMAEFCIRENEQVISTGFVG